MNDINQKYKENCLKYRKILDQNDIKSIFSNEEINNIITYYENIDLFIQQTLSLDNFYKKNEIMFTVCQGCSYYNQCVNNNKVKCKDYEPININQVEFQGDKKILKWFYINTLLYLNSQINRSKILSSFFDTFKRVKKIKISGKIVVMYGDSFHHYERVKNSTLLSYQGSSVEDILQKILLFITGNYYEFYFDNITNQGESKSPIEEKLFKSLNNHPYLRKKFNFNLEQQYIINDNFGNVMFTLDMLMTVSDKFKLCIECDGYNYHSDPERFELDRRRDRTLLKAGIYTARFTSYEINHMLDDVISDIIAITEYHLYNKF